MPKKIVLVSGSIASGKTTLVSLLEHEFDNVHVLKTKDIIRELAIGKLGHEVPSERRAMQDFGDRLDRDTKGEWVRDAVRKLLSRLGPLEPDATILVDAVRIPEQIKRIREAYGYVVVHIHLQAPKEILGKRYSQRGSDMKELESFSKAAENPTEAQVQRLADIADVVLDTKLCTKLDVLIRAATHLGFYSRAYARSVDVIVGGQFGSEGKGHIASYLAREYDVLVRVGGPNAGHKVYRDSSPYTHHQLPSGTLRNSLAKLVIAPGAVINPDRMLKEIADCSVDSLRLSIDPQAMIIIPRDIASEAGLKERIGSTGQGVGHATARRILDRGKNVKLAKDVKELRPFIRETWEVLESAYTEGKKTLVEGTQGSGLSLYHGSYPFVTSRDTNVGGCLSEAGVSPSRIRKIVMVCRTYPIRVQNPERSTSGRFGPENAQEIDWKTIAKRSRINLAKLQSSERTSTTNRKRRVGEFDWHLLRKAAALNGPTDIALTFTDYLNNQNASARRYEQLDTETIWFVEEVEKIAAAPVSLISTRFDFRSIIDRRAW